MAAVCGVTDLVRVDMHFERSKGCERRGNDVNSQGCLDGSSDHMFQVFAGTLSRITGNVTNLAFTVPIFSIYF